MFAEFGHMTFCIQQQFSQVAVLSLLHILFIWMWCDCNIELVNIKDVFPKSFILNFIWLRSSFICYQEGISMLTEQGKAVSFSELFFQVPKHVGFFFPFWHILLKKEQWKSLEGAFHLHETDTECCYSAQLAICNLYWFLSARCSQFGLLENASSILKLSELTKD